MWWLLMALLGCSNGPETCQEVREPCGCDTLCVSAREANRISREPQCDIDCFDTGASSDEACIPLDGQCQLVDG